MQQRYLSTWFADTILLHRCWVQVQQLKRYQQPFHPISSCLRRRPAKGTLELQGSWVGGFLGVMTCEFLPLKNTYLELYWYGRVMLKLVWYHPGSIRDVLLERILVAGGRIFAAPGTYNPIIHQNCSHQAQDPMTVPSWKLFFPNECVQFCGSTCDQCHLVNLSSFCRKKTRVHPEFTC